MNRIIQKRIEKLEGAAGKPSDLANLSDDELAATLDAARNGSLTTPEGFEKVVVEFRSHGCPRRWRELSSVTALRKPLTTLGRIVATTKISIAFASRRETL